MPAVYVDYRGREGVPAMRVGGMTVVERVVREAAKAGADRVVVHGDVPELPELPPEMEIDIELRAPGEPPPSDAKPIVGDVAGVTITDEESRKRASRALFASCRRPHDGLADKYVIRAISTRLSRAFCAIGATPNQVTSANIVVGFVACYFAALGNFVVAGPLMFLQLVLDSCDGELARVRHMHSRLGAILDNGSDDLIDNLFCACLAIGIGGVWMWIGIASAIARSFSAAMIHIDVARRGKAGEILAFKWFFDSEGEDLADRFETKQSVMGTVRAFGRRDMYGFVWFVTCVVGAPVVGLCLSIALSWAYFALAIVHLIVMRRQRRAR